jgi:hypothetical protein
VARLIRKRCAKCGVISRVKARERRCKQAAFGQGSFACYGNLELIIRRKIAPEERKDKLSEKLVQAHKGFEHSLMRMKRSMAAVSAWQKTIKRLERRIELRDHPQPPKPKKPRPRTRAIALPSEQETTEA